MPERTEPRSKTKLRQKIKVPARLKRGLGYFGMLPRFSQSARSDRAVLLEHETVSNRWHVGILKGGRRREYIPVSQEIDPAIVEAIERITRIPSETMTHEPEQKSLLQKFQALFEQGEASHNRAREAILRFDAAAARAKVSLKATRDLLDGPTQ